MTTRQYGIGPQFAGFHTDSEPIGLRFSLRGMTKPAPGAKI
jgi:hypothetical protein